MAASDPAGPEIRGAAPLGAVAERLARTFPDARTELDHRSAFELLVATVLSAQTTDVRVNACTPELFARWPDAPSLASADPAQVEQVIRPVGLAPTKSERIIGLAQRLLSEHGGEVPCDQAALEALPGVGRKTALVVRGAWFGESAFAVDTHVGRLARRLGWSASKDPRAVEDDVVARGSADTDLTALSLRLILLGRRVCAARSPRCGDCPLEDLCPRIGVTT